MAKYHIDLTTQDECVINPAYYRAGPKARDLEEE